MEILKVNSLFYGKICVDEKHKRPWGKKNNKEKETNITVMVVLPPDDSLSKEEIVL